jgi:hypothetical protein
MLATNVDDVAAADSDVTKVLEEKMKIMKKEFLVKKWSYKKQH